MGSDGAERRGWDFFISYTQADRAWAEWIAWVLEEDGHRVLIQAWDFVPGSNWIYSIQAGVRDASRTIAVLSEAYLTSVYGSAEWQSAWASNPDGSDRKLLVVRVAPCIRPGLLAGIVSVDLFGKDDAEAQDQLRYMVAAAEKGRVEPLVPPGFPGDRAMHDAPGFPGVPQSSGPAHLVRTRQTGASTKRNEETTGDTPGTTDLLTPQGMRDAVLDPAIPSAVKRELAQMPADRLVPFATPAGNVAGLVARREADAKAEAANERAVLAGGSAPVAFAVGCGAAVLARLLDWIGHFDPGNFVSHIITQSFALTSCTVLLWLAVALGACSFPLAAYALHQWRRAVLLKVTGINLASFDSAQPQISYHRQYVVPAEDLDDQSRRLWNRALHAAAEIPSTQTFATGLVDTVEPAAALPYRLWEIASGLASLTSACADVARMIEVTDPDYAELSASLSELRQTEANALHPLLLQISELENYATLLRDADDLIRRKKAAERQWKPSEHHVDLLARALPSENTPDRDARLTPDADTIRKQAAEAIRRADEAGRALLRSKDHQGPGRPKSTTPVS